ncbi:MAG: hypothetical protein GWP69_16340, partial [Gammaproteobacteria bacterium]|nr:hypothetical protein [Gammaproteobacteria bacterium]
MNDSLPPITEALSRLLRASAAGCCILMAGIQAHADEANNLTFAVSDVFPVTRSDLDFTDNPDLL